MKKCILGKGTELTHTFLKLAFSWPGNLVEAVTPHIALETSEFKSEYVGFSIFSLSWHSLSKP